MQLDVNRLAEGNVCEFAKQRYYGIARWRALWTVLVFILGIVIAGLIVLALVYVVDKQYVQAVVSGATGVIQGVPMRFILNRRSEAKAEEEAAFNQVRDLCGTTDDADSVRQQFTLLGIR